MNKFIKLIFSNTAKNSYITVGSNVLYGILIMAFFALSSRILGPEKFGLLSIALAIFTISFDILSLGSSQALVRFVSVALGKKQTNLAHQFTSVIFRLRLIEVIAILLLAKPLGTFIALNIYKNQQLLLPITVSIIAASGILLHEFLLSFL